MSDESEGTRQWIVEPPPGAGEVALYIEVSEGAELNDEQQAALSALLRSLEANDPEVTGHSADCPSYTACGSLKCGRVICGGLVCIHLAPKIEAAPAAGWNLMGSFGAMQ